MSIIIKRIIKFVVFSLLLVFFLVWLFSPVAVRHYLSEYLNQHQLALSESTSIRYNPFISQVKILDLTITKNKAINKERIGTKEKIGAKGKESAKNIESKQTVLSLQELAFEIRPYKLMFDTLYVSEFMIDGLHLNIETIDETLKIAGFMIPTADKNPDEASNETIPNKESVESPYLIGMPELTLKNSQIDIFLDGIQHQVKLNNIVISDLNAGFSTQSVDISIYSEINQSPLVININADLDKGNGDIGIDLNLSKLELSHFKHLLPEGIVAELAGQVSYSAEHKIKLIADSLLIDIVDVNFLMENINVAQGELELTLAEESFASKHLKLEKLNNGKMIINGDAELSLTNFKAFSQSEEQILASFEKLQLNNISLNTIEQVNAVDIANINLANLTFSNNVTDDIPSLAQFSNLDINQISLTEQGVNITDITLSDLKIDGQLDENKILVNLIDYLQPKNTAESIPPEVKDIDKNNAQKDSQVSEQVEAKDETAEQPLNANFFIKLAEFRLSNSAKVNFADNSVNPVYQRKIDITSFSVGPFNNQKPEQDSIFSIVGKSDKYAHLNFSGALRPFAATTHFTMKGFFKEVSLPGVSSYIKDALGYEIKSGQLDLGLNFVVEDTLIDGNTDVLLRGIELTSADDHEVDSFADKATMPFNVALDMLKDSDGNVDLSLPLTGNTDSPDFGVSGLMTLLIKQATMSAAKDYLIATFIPYANVVNIALAAGEYALKVRINDLMFKPQDVELPIEKQAFLDQFSALMKEEEDLQVKLCAVSTAADIGKKKGSKINDKDIEQLTEISSKRVHAFKDYMVEKAGVESSRLLLCTAQIDSSKNAKSKIAFVI